jgi:hypothetical protein
MKLNVLAFANTFGIIDLVLHLLFHLWGWFSPETYEMAMGEFVIGLHLEVTEHFTPMFFVFWLVEAAVMWLFGATISTLYNKLSA